MASPKLEVFFLYDSSTGAPKTGQTGITFTVYKDDLGVNVTQPSIVELGGGAYGFIPTFPISDDRGVFYNVNTGLSAAPQYVARYVRPEDYNADFVVDLRDFMEGKWQIHIDGPNANQMVFYASDGTTILKAFNLFDINGDPTSTNAFSRVPV